MIAIFGAGQREPSIRTQLRTVPWIECVHLSKDGPEDPGVRIDIAIGGVRGGLLFCTSWDGAQRGNQSGGGREEEESLNQQHDANAENFNEEEEEEPYL